MNSAAKTPVKRIVITAAAALATALVVLAVFALWPRLAEGDQLAQANRAYDEALDDPVLKLIPPGATQLQSTLRYPPCEGPSSEGPLLLVAYAAWASEQELLSFYEQEILRQGWHLEGESTGVSPRYQFTRSAEVLELAIDAIDDRPGETRIVLSLRPARVTSCP